jgi:hypothetical protein
MRNRQNANLTGTEIERNGDDVYVDEDENVQKIGHGGVRGSDELDVFGFGSDL